MQYWIGGRKVNIPKIYSIPKIHSKSWQTLPLIQVHLTDGDSLVKQRADLKDRFGQVLDTGICFLFIKTVPDNAGEGDHWKDSNSMLGPSNKNLLVQVSGFFFFFFCLPHPSQAHSLPVEPQRSPFLCMNAKYSGEMFLFVSFRKMPSHI